MPGVYCCVKVCRERQRPGDGVKYHRLPLLNEGLCIQWLLRAGFSIEDIRKRGKNKLRSLRVCGRHFQGESDNVGDILPSINISAPTPNEAAHSPLLSGDPPPQADLPTADSQPMVSTPAEILPRLAELSGTFDNEPRPGTSQSSQDSAQHEHHTVPAPTPNEAAHSLLLSGDPPPQADLLTADSQPMVSTPAEILPRLAEMSGTFDYEPCPGTSQSSQDSAHEHHSVIETLLGQHSSPSQHTTSTGTTTSSAHSTSPSSTTRKALKRKLFLTSSSQVTPKHFKSRLVQQTPPMQRSTQVTPRMTKNVKSNTELLFSTASQTDQGVSPSILVKQCNIGSQTDRIATSDKYVQASVPKIDQIKSSDKELKKFTGIEDYKLFQILHKYLVSSCSDNDCDMASHITDPSKVFKHISTEDQLLLVLYKLKRNPIDSVIASEFKVSTGRVSEIFKFWICRMYRKFKILKIWPTSEKIEMHMPLSTKQNFPDLAAISDCVEFSTQVPRGPVAGKQLFSHYKNCHTTKVMYTTAPNGALIHCSDVYGGSASDKEIFGQSDLANRLKPGQGLMVDKGFLIKDLIQGKDIKLYRPPFLSEKSKQFQPDSRDSGRLIARSRITVENFNARLSTFAFLKQKKIPVVTLPIMNEIGFVCGFLANLGPLIRQPKITESQHHHMDEDPVILDQIADLNAEPEDMYMY